MSYDLQVFSCVDPSEELSRLSLQGKLERCGTNFALVGDTWQATFHIASVEPEDVPPSVFREAPGFNICSK